MDAETARGRMLHFILPEVLRSSSSHQSFCAKLRLWVGGTQEDTVKTVWLQAEAPAKSAKVQAMRWNFMGFSGGNEVRRL